ncbi:MAG: efflux RND transporter periplasmic adaptor subunit [Bacteroidia bacterium]|nr:efflux RND transporter periplasmic adaptor subunit [Bacteroidia bacterium]
MNLKINKQILLTAISMLALGFLIAWVIKPGGETAHQHEHTNEKAGTNFWTCSMHPHIRQAEAGLCPICEMDLIPAESSSSSNPMELEMSEEAVKLAQIETIRIGTGRSSGKTLRMSGKIQADERLGVSQVAHVPGRIEKLYVSFTGEQVRRGQKLADIYSPELFTAQEELLQALKFAKDNPDLLEAARKKLEYWKISPEQIAQIEKSKEVMGTFTLYADASGIVKERKVSLGDHVDPGDLLFELQSLNRLWLIFDAYEEDLGQIHLGDKISFTTAAVPGKTFETRVSFIDPVINPNTRAAAIRGEIINRGQKLKPEMFINGELQSAGDSKESLMIPKSAVLWTGKRSIVYVQKGGTAVPTYEFREVELGERMGNQYVVASGLKAGEEIVSQGSFSIDAAAQLNNQNSMMNRWLEEEMDGTAVPNYRSSTPASFVTQLSEAATAYLNLKDALVESDQVAAQKGVTEFSASLSAVNMGDLTGDAHNYWMTQLKALETHGKKIAGSEDVEEQRKQFSFLSMALINSLQAFGYTDTLYVQHCPMAMDNTGANWLSAENQVLNPYFGDKMLKCGSVEAVLSEHIKIN